MWEGGLPPPTGDLLGHQATVHSRSSAAPPNNCAISTIRTTASTCLRLESSSNGAMLALEDFELKILPAVSPFETD